MPISSPPCIPRAIQLVIDDVAWREGWSLADEGGPWRAGVDRFMEPEDYLAIAHIGQSLSIRPQAACVLCQWDTENVCACCPTSTHAGTAWDNSARVGPWLGGAREVFAGSAAHIELALHGVGHEHWEQGARTRAEWFGAPNGAKWPWADLLRHLQTFTALLDQHDLGPAAGHRFPVSAVPCAFIYCFDDADPESTGALFAQAGVRQVSTPFGGGFARRSALLAADGGYDHGLPVLDRGGNGVPYDVFDTVPAQPTPNSICGIHWPNLLRPDPQDNALSVARWVDYLRRVSGRPDAMLAANANECFTQWAYCSFTHTHWDGRTLTIDATAMPDEVLATAERGPLWVKVALGEGEEVSRIEGDRLVPVAYCRGDRDALIALKGAAGKLSRVELAAGQSPPQALVTARGTCTILNLTDSLTETVIDLEVFGRQEIAVRLRRPPASVMSSTPRVRFESIGYAADEMTCTLTLRGHDIQGERAQVTLSHALA